MYDVMGCQYDRKTNSTHFALFSTTAKYVELCLLNNGCITTIPILDKNGDIWSICIEDANVGTHYCYRIDKNTRLLLDPYAKAVEKVGNQLWNIIIDDDYDWQGDVILKTPWSKTIIYEAHVKGLTKLHPAIPPSFCGTYAGLAHPVMLDYLTQLGITAIELLPVQFHLDEPRLQQLGLSNYWGYNVIAPFAVESKYWSRKPNTTPLSEFNDMVKALHRAGIEVILDVVFNHTAELDKFGPTLSLKSIDAEDYYWRDNQGDFINWTGCGNTLKLTEPNVIRWVMDCLRHWVTVCHVDGFRFDLATILGRTPEFTAKSSLLIAIKQDPILQSIKLIAEPWDIGQQGYQLGSFPYPFAEWNDQYRDDIRRFWLQGDLTLGEFSHRFAASSQLFDKQGRKPNSSINFITCHDGFTLNDLVSFEKKHNQSNGENNRDGNNMNWSVNFGIEGNLAPDDIFQKRLTIKKSLLTTLLLSQGTPMLLAGDELGNSQQGNNNGYCQDNELTWLSWPPENNQNTELLDHVKTVIKIKKQIPALNQNHWWKDNVQGQGDVRWLNQLGELISINEWQDKKQSILQIELSGRWLLVINTSDIQQSFYILNRVEECILGKVEQSNIEHNNWKIDARTVSILILAGKR